MNPFSIAYKNFTKKFSFYALYLFSVSLVIMIFFAFTSFSINHVMLEKSLKTAGLNRCAIPFPYF